jgi:hypothetical protein
MNLLKPVLAVVPVGYAVFLSLIRKLSNRGLQYPGSQVDIAPGIFEGIDDHFFFQVGRETGVGPR